jgi:hypothetical protein
MHDSGSPGGEAPAERVTVDEQGAQTGTDGRDRQAAGQDAGAGATPAADHGEDAAGRSVLGPVGEAVDQPRLGGRQNGDVLGPEQLGHLPRGLDGGSAADDGDPRAPGQPGPETGIGLIGPDEHQRRGRIAGTSGSRVGRDVDIRAGRRGQPNELVDQIGVGGDDEGQA